MGADEPWRLNGGLYSTSAHLGARMNFKVSTRLNNYQGRGKLYLLLC
jgi:hypothetical protein